MGGSPWKLEPRKNPCGYWLFPGLRGFFVFSLFVLVLLRMKGVGSSTLLASTTIRKARLNLNQGGSFALPGDAKERYVTTKP